MEPREPRIATLLLSEPFNLDSSKPLPVEPHTQPPQNARPTQSAETSRHRHQKSALPLAGVLNNEDYEQRQVHNAETSPGVVPVFSGSLSDILLEPLPRKRRKIDDLVNYDTSSASDNRQSGYSAGNELDLASTLQHASQSTQPDRTLHDKLAQPASTQASAGLTLPKPQPLKKGNRRPRIPPLLQGLHQPPPDARLFPPITGEKGGFREAFGESSSRIAPQSELEHTNSTAVIAEREKEDAEVRDEHQKTANDQDEAASNVRRLGGKKERPKGQKRNKWTDQETRDLLRGVSQFGIGSWKKILEHKEYTFNARTSVDLKDRFRTCCPQEYKKFRAGGSSNPTPAATDASQQCLTTTYTAASNAQTPSKKVVATAKKSSRKPRSGTHRKGAAELAEMGIDKPFKKSDRRERREFTDRDDEALLRGFERYGPSWHSIRDDLELGFHGRRPTDLRDRFRIRYSDRYAKAGYKLREKDLQKQHVADDEDAHRSSAVKDSDPIIITARSTDDAAHTKPPASEYSVSLPADTTTKPHNLLKPLSTAFPTSFDDFSDLMSEDEASYSPITLSRNIFQWADANPSFSQHTSGVTSALTAPLTGSAAVADITSHLNFNFLTGMDQFHINPLATLNLPATMSSSAFSMTIPATITPSNVTSSGQSSSIPSTTSTSGPTHLHTAAPSANKTSQNSLLLTPNLPTILFPNVPESSAKNGVHNLPPPADLLSGLDLESRTDVVSQHAQFLWEEPMLIAPSFANGGGSGGSGQQGTGHVSGTGTVTGTVAFRGMGLFESEGLGERSLLNSSI